MPFCTQFNNNVKELISFVKKHVKIITDNGEHSSDATTLCRLLKALSLGMNALFNHFIEGVKNNVDLGIGSHAKIASKELMVASITIYNI